MESELDLRRILNLIRQWLWLVVSCAALAGVIAFGVTSRIPTVYKASVTLLIQQSPSSSAGDYTDVLTSERQAHTYAEIAKDEVILQAVIGQLGLAMSSDQIAGKVSIELVPNTQLIRVNVQDSDEYRAPQIANGIADALIAQSHAIQDARYADSLGNVQGQMGEMTTLMEDTQAAIAALGAPTTSDGQAELARMETILAGYRNSYAILVQSYEQMRLAARSADNIVILRRALEPAKPVMPSKTRNALLVGLAGGVLALGVVFLAEYLDDTIKTPDDVNKSLDLDTLATVGRLQNEEGELITLTNPLSPMSEAFRMLRTNIRFASVDKPIKTLLVTSTGPSEGKTFATANLAVAMAQAGSRVILVDADLRRPRLHKVFDFQPRGGLTDALLEGKLDGRLQPGQVDGLEILPAGASPPNPAELLDSRRMQELLDSLSQRADIVLVDSPPGLPLTDAAVLAREVDGVLLVVASGEVRRGAVRQAVKSLHQAGTNIIGVMLNKVAVGQGSYYDYYYYHYHDRRKKGRTRRQIPLLHWLKRLGKP